MKKKQYIAPTLLEFKIAPRNILTGSLLDAVSDPQAIIPSDELFEEEFSAPSLDVDEFDLLNP